MSCPEKSGHEVTGSPSSCNDDKAECALCGLAYPRRFSIAYNTQRRASRPTQPELGPHGADESKDAQEGDHLIMMEFGRVEEIRELDEGPIRQRADDQSGSPEDGKDGQWHPPRPDVVREEHTEGVAPPTAAIISINEIGIRVTIREWP